jgi:hypothetical protein
MFLISRNVEKHGLLDLFLLMLFEEKKNFLVHQKLYITKIEDFTYFILKFVLSDIYKKYS